MQGVQDRQWSSEVTYRLWKIRTLEHREDITRAGRKRGGKGGLEKRRGGWIALKLANKAVHSQS